ncbi:ABC transporter permease [Halalkalibacterium ligniniphilum]|uniref:ABC transporter permease n=1 Tax=Halalkalibacterium ligniniphilum TaxID=1134413 RepID=UPI00034A48FD|nr:ABC transporter permease [Halalkalibacterium ligniniphilum]
MSNFWTVVHHTYINRVKSKAFIISTIITLLFVLLFVNVDRIMMAFEGDGIEKHNVAVIDETGEWYEPLENRLEPLSEQIIVQSFEGTVEQGRQSLLENGLQGLLVLSEDEDGQLYAVYYTESFTQTFAANQIQQELQQLKQARATNELGLSEAELQAIYTPISFELEAASEGTGNGVRSEEELNQARFLVYILLFVIYFSVIMYGNMIATEVATEKSSRVMEILISSVSPVTQMFGKILGIAFLALTQFLLILLVGGTNILNRFNGESANGMGMEEAFQLSDMPIDLILYSILFLILGYLLYATLSAMLGSLVSRIEDVNQTVGPLNFLIIAAFFVAMFGLNAPESTIVTVTSFIPFFAPMIMFLRVGMTSVPIWEVLLSIGLLVGTIFAFALLAARVYKGGVLMYGKGSSLKDIKQAFALSKKER